MMVMMMMMIIKKWENGEQHRVLILVDAKEATSLITGILSDWNLDPVCLGGDMMSV